MEIHLEISRSNINRSTVFFNRMIRFVRIGLLLHLTALGGIFLFFRFGSYALEALGQQHSFSFIGYGFMAGYGFVLPFFAELDAFSRYQNYKRANDLFHEKGFKGRIANLFVHSRCQREAIKVAARDLDLLEEILCYYSSLGFKWYHLLPQFVFSKPLLLLSGRYWKKTLFEEPYESKYFLW